MTKLSLSSINNFQNSAISIVNSNSDLIEAAIENTLSRDGTSPNEMQADFDMNSNRILNCVDALTNQEPVTLSQLNTALAIINGLSFSSTLLQDPNADRIVFWDDSEGKLAYLTPGTNLTITGTTLNATGGGGAGTITGPGSSTDNAVVRWDGTTGTIIQNSLVIITDSGELVASSNVITSLGSNAGFKLGERDGSGEWILYADASLFRIWSGSDLVSITSTGELRLNNGVAINYNSGQITVTQSANNLIIANSGNALLTLNGGASWSGGLQVDYANTGTGNIVGLSAVGSGTDLAISLNSKGNNPVELISSHSVQAINSTGASNFFIRRTDAHGSGVNVGSIQALGTDSAAGIQTYNEIIFNVLDNTSGSEDSRTDFTVFIAGTEQTMLRVSNNIQFPFGYSTGIIHSDGTGNLTSSAVNLASADVTGDLPFANLTQGSARSVLGVTGNSTADVASIQGTADQVLVVNTAGTALAFGTVATGGITNSAVTYAKIQNVSATSRVLGRITAGAGIVEELTGANIKTIVGSGDLTKTDDTNVTLTLGGTPTAALFNAVSLTLGWTGTLAVSRGGIGVGTITGIMQGNGTSAVTGISNSSTVGQTLRVTGASTYAWGQLDLSNTNAVTGQLISTSFPALTGDVTTPGGSLVTTLATVNATPGTFGSATQVSVFTVNTKGLTTAATNTLISIPHTQINDFTSAVQGAVGSALVDHDTTDLFAQMLSELRLLSILLASSVKIKDDLDDLRDDIFKDVGITPEVTKTDIRELLTANRTYYVSTTGDDSASGLSVGSAVKTIQHAIDLASMLDRSIYIITIKVAPGTYSEGLLISDLSVTLQGDNANPSNCHINPPAPANNKIINIGPNANVIFTGFKLSSTTASACISSLFGGSLTIGTIEFGALPNGHHLITEGGDIYLAGSYVSEGYQSYVISGSAQIHFFAGEGVISSFDVVNVTLTGTPNFTNYFAYSNMPGKLLLAGYGDFTFTGAATGPRYFVEGNGVIKTFGAGPTYLPGDVAGTTSTGGQYL